jgi:membrane fusion protein, multidrug efflux system
MALAGLCGCSHSTGETPVATPSPPLPVQVVHVKRGEATRSITLPANIVAYHQATLYAKVGGYVKTVLVDKGDAVKAGALLADIEVPELLADRARYQADVDVAGTDYRRVSEAQKKAPDLVMPQTVDDAKGRLDIAKANLERTETLLNFAKITAPFSGVITKRLIDPGAFIPAATAGSAVPPGGTALFALADFSRVRVQVPVPEPEVPFIKTGLPVKITVDGLPGKTFDGSVTRFAYALDEATKTMLTEIELPNPSGELRPGMYARTRLSVETRLETLVVPADALLIEKARSSVFTVADGHAKRVTVKIGFNEAGWAEVLDGAKLGDPVILLGKQAVADGQPVSATEAR